MWGGLRVVSFTQDLPRGTGIADYRIDAVLGRGGMSVVYLAEDLRLKRRVALKLLSPALAADARFRERFLSESELAASIDQANVIPVYAAGEADGSLFIAMRYVEGSDLKALIREGPLSEEQAVVLVEQLARGLDAAHERGLVHGDVKPSNVLIDSRGHPYLADFGLTRRLGDATPTAGEASLMGTIDYVAPEQIRGDPVDARADVYSLGCLLFECLTGRQPFARGTEAAVLFAHLEDTPPATGGPIDAVIAKALAKSPAERYDTCGELADAAREALGIAAPRAERWPIAVAGLAGAIVIGSVVAFLTLHGSAPPAPQGELLRIAPATNRVVGRTVAIGGDPSAIAADARRIWITSLGDDSVWRIDTRSLTSVRIPVAGTPTGVATSGTSAYVANTLAGGFYGTPGEVTRIAGEAGAATDSVQTGQAYAIASGPSGVWIARANGIARIASVSTFAGKVDRQVAQPCCANGNASPGIAVGAGAVWMLDDALGRRLWRLAPGRPRAVATISLPFMPAAVAASPTAIWVTAQLADEVARIDPSTNRIVDIIKVGREPLAIAVGVRAVWVANAIDRTVTRIDPATDHVVATIRLDSSPQAIATADGSAWVATDAD